jgi:hypothetical protein
MIWWFILVGVINFILGLLVERYVKQNRENVLFEKSIIVLAVSHRVQLDDPTVPFKTIDDPVYKELLRGIISNEHLDFVGEEAGDKTTHAEQITQDLLGAGHYLNVNPPVEDLERLGVAQSCHGSPLGEPPVMYWSIEKNETRENFWVDRIVESNPTRGLLICGCFHAFSAAAKLFDRKFKVETRTYMPWDKLAG